MNKKYLKNKFNEINKGEKILNEIEQEATC